MVPEPLTMPLPSCCEASAKPWCLSEPYSLCLRTGTMLPITQEQMQGWGTDLLPSLPSLPVPHTLWAPKAGCASICSLVKVARIQTANGVGKGNLGVAAPGQREPAGPPLVAALKPHARPAFIEMYVRQSVQEFDIYQREVRSLTQTSPRMGPE